MIKRLAWLTLMAMAVASGCSSQAANTGTEAAGTPAGVLRLGYMTEAADASALVGLRLGYLARDLGQVSLEPVAFSTTVAEERALASGQLDAAYIDPVAAVAAWQASQHQVRIIAGAASGGAQLVARPGISSAGQLAHAVVAAPAGTAQQAALAWWLKQRGILGRGPANVTMTTATLANELRAGTLVAAWEPSPVDMALTGAGGHVLVDEASLWTGGRFPTAVLAVSTRYLAAHAAAVALLLRGHIQTEQLLATNKTFASMVLSQAGTNSVTPAALRRSLAPVQFTDNPLAAEVRVEADHATATGLLGPVGTLSGLFNTAPLNRLLKAAGLPQVPE